MFQVKPDRWETDSKEAATTPIGVAVIGCGYWGTNYVRVFNELPDARVIAICEKRAERLAEMQERLPNTILTANLGEVLANPLIQAVVISTEASSHFEIALKCLDEGKHLLIEKPITTTAADAEKLTCYADARKRVLMVGHTFIYNTGVRKVKELLDTRQDDIYYLHSSRTNLGPIRRDVNALWDLATHDIAIFNYLLDDVPDWVSAVGAKVLRNCREDVGFACLGYSGNIVAHIHVSWADPNKAREVVVVCSERRIVFNDLSGMEQVRIYERGIKPMTNEPTTYGEYRLQIRDGDILSPRIEPREPLKDECRHFLDCIRSGRSPLTSGLDGNNVLLVLEAMDKSIRNRGGQVEVQKHVRQQAPASNSLRRSIGAA
jgi:predicted dehydrogenase